MKSGGIISSCCHNAMTSYSPGNPIIGPAGHSPSSGSVTLGYCAFASKFSGWGAGHFAAQGLQVGFGTYVHPSASIGSDVTIGHGVIIEAGVHIGNRVTIESQVYVGVGAHIGDGCTIEIGVRLLDMKPSHKRPVIIGYEVTVQAGVIIGPNDRQIIPHYSTVQSGIIIREDTRFFFVRGSEILAPLERNRVHYRLATRESVNPAYTCVLVLVT